MKGFNFLVNSYWIEIEQRIEDNIPVIFATKDPLLFHKVYIYSSFYTKNFFQILRADFVEKGDFFRIRLLIDCFSVIKNP